MSFDGLSIVDFGEGAADHCNLKGEYIRDNLKIANSDVFVQMNRFGATTSFFIYWAGDQWRTYDGDRDTSDTGSTFKIDKLCDPSNELFKKEGLPGGPDTHESGLVVPATEKEKYTNFEIARNGKQGGIKFVWSE